MSNAIGMLARVAAISLLGLSVACTDTRPEVNFDTDPQILRGAWKVTLEDSKQVKTFEKLDVVAQYVNDSSYQLGGSVTLNGKTLAVTGTGRPYGKLVVRTQTTPVPDIVLQDADGKTWSINYNPGASTPKFQGFFEDKSILLERP
jgi:hypothetical protein